jgi:hypothetical protein
MPEYNETEVSKIARSLIKESVDANILKKEFLDLSYKPEKRSVLSEAGQLNIEKVFESIGTDYQESGLIFRAVELNLTKEEMNEVIKYRFRHCYCDWENKENARSIVNSAYPAWCETFGITPEEGFDVFDNV